MTLRASTLRNTLRSTLRGGGGADPLAFHALDLVNGVFSADVIKGVGNLTEARTSTIYLPDASGVWQPFTSGVPGEYYANGQWWLYGAPLYKNEIIYSRDLTQWTQVGTAVSAYDAVGLEGVANTASTLTNNDSGAHELVNVNVTIPADTNTHIHRYTVKKDTVTTRFPALMSGKNGGPFVLLHLNTATGALTEAALVGALVYTTEVNLVGDWWEVLIAATNQSTTNFTGWVNPADGTVAGTRNTAATGSIIDGNTGLVLNKSIANLRGSSPIFTSGSAQTINATANSFDIANHNNTQGGYFIEWTPQFATSEASGNIEIISLNGGADLLFYDATNSLLKSTDGTNTASVALTVVAGTTYKLWVAYGSGSLQVGVGVATGTATSYDGAFATGTKIEVTARSAYVQLAADLRRYNQTFPAAVTTLQALAA